MWQQIGLKLFFFGMVLFNWQCSEIHISEGLKNEAVYKLQEASQSQEFWVKVHALEYLQALGYQSWVDSIQHHLVQDHEEIAQERIGVWRIKAKDPKLSTTDNAYIRKIIAVYADTSNTDRLHAAETLAKLGYSLKNFNPQLVNRDLRSGYPMSGYVLWGETLPVKFNETFSYSTLLDSLFHSEDSNNKKIWAYALTKIGLPMPKSEYQQLSHYISNNKLEEGLRDRLNLALYLNSDDATLQTDQSISEILPQILKSQVKSSRYAACEALALRGDKDDVESLQEILSGRSLIQNSDLPESLIHSQNLDCQSAAAFAILSIEQRSYEKLSIFDWFIVVGFLLLMVAIGYYYAGENKNKDDYLLGGRSMNPYMIGLSLFATLLSTLSYLAYPGEMIKYGPMVFFGILAFPVAYIIVSHYLIPEFMRQNVTSAYEILEVKLGPKVRDLATVFFLLLRFLWMSTIVYATVNTALIHILGFDESYVPLVCLVLALITVVYTVLGGLKAVVLTDAIQSGILLVGAVLTIVVISFEFGKTSIGLPIAWMEHWEPLNWSIDFNQRMTIGNIFIMTLVWQICTAGADQMAIQRYLSTSSVQQAKKSFKISLISSGIVQLTLAVLGLTVAAYFIQFPNMMEYGKTVYQDADMLFPRFILIGLPVGVSGLVVAGIMAAAMSSLSSGLNSSSSVIVEDVIIRHFPQLLNSKGSLYTIKIVSIILGVVVTICSMLVGFIEGNLLDIVIKLVNLFVAPLFVLFFLALFVPQATDKGTLLGGLFSLFIAILIAFFNLFQLSILTIMPIALVVGAVSGWIFSLFDRQYFLNHDK